MILALCVDRRQCLEHGAGLVGCGVGCESDDSDGTGPFRRPCVERVVCRCERAPASSGEDLRLPDGVRGVAELLSGLRGVGGELVGMVEQAVK